MLSREQEIKIGIERGRVLRYNNAERRRSGGSGLMVS
jgi:hypothetical protein